MLHIKLMSAARWRGGNEVLAHTCFYQPPRLICFFTADDDWTEQNSSRRRNPPPIALALHLSRINTAENLSRNLLESSEVQGSASLIIHGGGRGDSSGCANLPRDAEAPGNATFFRIRK